MRKTRKVDVLNLDGNSITLESIIEQLNSRGITDFSRVTFEKEYVRCQGHPEGEYCYCPPTWTDIRLQWEFK